MPPTNPIIDFFSITEDKVFNALTSLDSTKATGIDGISPAVLKHCAYPLTKPLHYLFSYAIYYCCFPSEWRIHCIIPNLKLVIKIVFLTTDPYLYFAKCPRYSNILLMIKSLVLFLIISPLSVWIHKGSFYPTTTIDLSKTYL